MPSPKRFLSLLLLLLSLCALQAAPVRIGIEGSVNYSIISTETRWDNTYWYNFVGLDIAIPVKACLSEHFALTSGIRYIMKSAYYKHEYNGSVDDEYAVLHHFLEFPLTAEFMYSTGKGLSLTLGAGGYLGVRLAETHAGRSSTLLNGSPFYIKNAEINSNDNRFDGGILAEAGVGFPKKHGDLYVKARYQHSLTSLAKDTQRDTAHTYIHTLSLSVGYLFGRSGKK